MKFKYRYQHTARDQTGSDEITEAWQDLILPSKYAKGVVKEEKK